MNWEMLGCMLGIFASFSALMIWLMSRMENRLDAHMTSGDAKWMAMNARVYTTEALLMRLIEKLEK